MSREDKGQIFLGNSDRDTGEIVPFNPKSINWDFEKTDPSKNQASGDVGKLVKNWIQKAIKKPGSLRKSLGVKKGKKIPAKKLNAAAKKPGKLGQRARLAKTLKGLKK